MPQHTQKSKADVLFTLAENLGDVFWCVNESDRSLEYLNPASAEVLGRPPEAFYANPRLWREIIHPQDRTSIEQSHEILLELGTVSRRYRIVHPDGRILWMQESAWRICDSDNGLRYLFGIAHDVSRRTHGTITANEQPMPHRSDFDYRRLTKLSEQLPGFIYQYQLSPGGHGSFPYASSKSWEIYGVGPESLAVSDCAAVAAVHPDDRARVVESIQYSAISLEPWQCEYRIQHPLGHELWAFGRATPERLEDGTVLWHGYISNITQRKETQFELESSEARYRQIAEHFSDLVCMHDASPEARYRFVSPSALALLGYRPEEMLDRSAYEFIHPDDRQRIRDMSHRHVLSGIPDPGIEHRMPHRQGHYLWVESKAMPLLSAGGKVIGMQTISRDITQRREAQEAFKALAQRQERILEAAGEGIFGVDHQGLVNFVNPAAARMLGWERDSIVGQDSHRLFHHTRQDGSHFPAEECLVLQALRTGEEQRSSDEWFWRRDGSGFAVELVASPLLEGSTATGCVVVFQDITERKRSERLLQEISSTDALTGVANRRHFLQRLEQELSRLTRHGGAASLVMFDADRFKKINDTWGHAAGDEVLLGLSAACLKRLRGSDMLGRLGGEEFAVLLPETDGRGGLLFAERLRQAVEALEIPYRGNTLRLTVSLGVTDIRPGESPESILERADRAMYRAKRDGRNGTCSEFGGADHLASH